MASQEVKAIFEPRQFTLEYGVEMAGNGAVGTVEGNTSQTVAFGASGTEVEAKPAAGSFFGGWSDGVRTAKRSDGAKDLQVKAIFGKLATLPHANNLRRESWATAGTQYPQGQMITPGAWRVWPRAMWRHLRGTLPHAIARSSGARGTPNHPSILLCSRASMRLHRISMWP